MADTTSQKNTKASTVNHIAVIHIHMDKTFGIDPEIYL